MGAKSLVNHPLFSKFILGVIVLNAILIGISTYAKPYSLLVLENICIWIFVAEILLKFIGRDSTRAFFGNGWNIFDLIVVGSAFIPNVSTMATLLRVLRVFRVLRLIDGLPELRLIVSVLVKSMTSMTYISLLMFICFYIYAVLGVEMFGKTQPAEFGNLQEAFFTLFRVLTCDAWIDLRKAALPYGNYWIVTGYHVSWIIVSTFLLANLVVGAVMNNYQLVHDREIEGERGVDPDSDEAIDARITELTEEIAALVRRRARRD